MLRALLRRNAILISACVAAGLLQWGFVKLAALGQSPEEFGRFASLAFLALIVSMPLVTLQSGVARQVTSLVASGSGASVGPYLRRLLAAWALPGLAVCAALFALAAPITEWLRLADPWSVRVLTGVIAAFLPLQLVLGTLAARDRLSLLAAVLLTDGVLRCGIALAWPEAVATTTGALAVTLVALGGAVALGAFWIRDDLFSRGEAPTTRLPAVLPRFALGALLFYAAAFQDALLVRLVFGGAEAARYDAAVTLGRIVHALPYPLIPVLVPAVARLSAEGRSARPTLLVQLVTVAAPAAMLTVGGALHPALLGSLILDPGKHADLGPLVPLALGTAGFFAMTSIVLHYLLARGRFGILFVTAAAAAAGAVAALAPPHDAKGVLTRMACVAGACFAAAVTLGIAGSRPRAPRDPGRPSST